LFHCTGHSGSPSPCLCRSGEAPLQQSHTAVDRRALSARLGGAQTARALSHCQGLAPRATARVGASKAASPALTARRSRVRDAHMTTISSCTGRNDHSERLNKTGSSHLHSRACPGTPASAARPTTTDPFPDCYGTASTSSGTDRIYIFPRPTGLGRAQCAGSAALPRPGPALNKPTRDAYSCAAPVQSRRRTRKRLFV
jgi:hypothetical protein